MMPPSSTPLHIGILDLQGCVMEHIPHLEKLGARIIRVKNKSDLEQIDGLILPGGESTTQLKLIEVFNLKNALLTRAREIPFWGVCAGAILMAREVSNPAQESLNLIDVSIERNAYGRQLESFNQKLRGEEVSLIRAPKLTRISSKLLQTDFLENNAVQVVDPATGHQVSTFHPELSPVVPSIFYREFVRRCEKQKLATPQTKSSQVSSL